MVDEWMYAMNIIVCGAGKTGAHAAGVLAAEGANVTIVDHNQILLDTLADTLDVATILGQPLPVLRNDPDRSDPDRSDPDRRDPDRRDCRRRSGLHPQSVAGARLGTQHRRRRGPLARRWRPRPVQAGTLSLQAADCTVQSAHGNNEKIIE